ncbi:MAG: hypothetical protein M0C28_37845 [Candidatus Moduliflexus flocculans]|nr:hypothetical protein [Candidatus Moduliflexus flocculans]
MERKEFLKLAGAAAAGSLLARCSPAPEAWNGAAGDARITVKIYELKLRQAWGLSRGTWTTRRNAFVRIERDGVAGLGEAAPIARYSETAESAAAFIEKARPILLKDLREYAVRFGEIEALGPGEHAAKAALDMAVLDWVGRKLGEPVWRLLGPGPGQGRDHDLFHRHRRGAGDAAEGPRRRRFRRLQDQGRDGRRPQDHRGHPGGHRQAPDHRRQRGLENQGRGPGDDRLDGRPGRRARGAAPARRPAGGPGLAQGAGQDPRSSPTRCLIRPSDLPRIAPYFHGVNVKVMKCGGLQEAVRLAGMARALGLKLMIGCMIESSLGISAAAAVASLFDRADLDGNILISNDPFRGVKTVKDVLVLGDGPGLGVTGDLP